jgi:hypothetical protein
MEQIDVKNLKEKEQMLDLLKKMNEKIDKLQEETDILNKENTKLKFAADKGRMALYESRTSGDIEKRIRLRIFNGKIVTHWKLVKNLVEKINGIWVEDQKLNLIYEDGSEDINIDLINFERNFTRMEAVVKEISQTKTDTIYAVETESGKKIRISYKFIN